MKHDFNKGRNSWRCGNPCAVDIVYCTRVYTMLLVPMKLVHYGFQLSWGLVMKQRSDYKFLTVLASMSAREARLPYELVPDKSTAAERLSTSDWKMADQGLFRLLPHLKIALWRDTFTLNASLSLSLCSSVLISVSFVSLQLVLSPWKDVTLIQSVIVAIWGQGRKLSRWKAWKKLARKMLVTFASTLLQSVSISIPSFIPLSVDLHFCPAVNVWSHSKEVNVLILCDKKRIKAYLLAAWSWVINNSCPFLMMKKVSIHSNNVRMNRISLCHTEMPRLWWQKFQQPKRMSLPPGLAVLGQDQSISLVLTVHSQLI